MKQGIQTFMAEAGQAACYALCIMQIAERIIRQHLCCAEDLIKAIDAGYIQYNWSDPNDNNNFTVLKPAEWLSRLTGGKWSVEKVPADYNPKPGEYVVDRWERKITGITIGHFRLPDWDSLEDSQTVKYGKIVSRRVFRKIS